MARQADQQVTFADVEMRRQGVVLERTLQRISTFLDRQSELVNRVHADLVRDLKRPKTGRDGLSAAQVLRSFILLRIKNWDLRELRERIADGYTLRLFTHFHSGRVPNHQTFNRNFNRLQAQTIRFLNEAVVDAAVEMRLADVRKMRTDTTVVETNIHFPTDSGLLWDVVRVQTRLVNMLREELGDRLGCDFSHRTRRARRRMQEISRMTGRTRTRQQVRKYRDLIRVTEEVMQMAAAHAHAAKGLLDGLDPMRAALVSGVAAEIEEFGRLGQRVVDQTRRRVLGGEQVLVEEKLFSIFEPHTDLIVRGKTRTPVEFGHKVRIVEGGYGLITDYETLVGNPADQAHVKPTLEHHQKRFDAPPELLAADRAFHSEDNLTACKQAGVTECIPQRGGQKTAERAAYEKSRAFKKGQRFRAGIEGRISVLFRGRGMKRCLRHGLERFEVFVGAAVLANNLLVLAALLEKKHRRAA
ncbi:MAG TPA: ISNCY family transposase [bacterium]|nr:ISNCY family transposase [bacterium]